MYSLFLSEEGRILSATFLKYNKTGVIVDSLPKGNISDYKYINKRYIYDPLTKEKEEESLNPGKEIALLKQRINVLEREAIKQK